MKFEPFGLVEHVSPFNLNGWALDKANPHMALDLVLRIDGIAVDWFRPNSHMPAIAEYLGWPQSRLGLIGFNITMPEWVADGRTHTMEVMVLATGTVLKSSQTTVCYIPPHKPLDALQIRFNQPQLHPHQRAPSILVPQVSIVVLNRNGCSVLPHLFQSWQRHNHTVPVEWIVVDHASTDGSLALLEAWRQRLALKVLPLTSNDSFSASCNRAAAVAVGDYLLFLNNDIIWLHDALPELLATLSDPTVGAVGLKLLKTSGGDAFAKPGHTSVQHLGVRYAQQHDGYWPYEATPSQNNAENEFASQQVLAVTAAVMLCRRTDFEQAGRFDERFFYGFEDVEFCLRLGARLRKKVICRNDLTALHRHGHTRLTGRERGQFDRILHNARVLGTQTGLWAKAAWRNSLLSSDRLMCSERLTIGLVLDQPLSAATPAASRSNQWALRLGRAIEQAHPKSRVVLVHPGVDAYDVRGLHVLVVPSAGYNIGLLRNARPDLIVLAWVAGPLPKWLARPWWLSFHGYLAPTAARASQLTTLAKVQVETSCAAVPLGHNLVPAAWPLRVGVDWPDHPINPSPPKAALTLQAQLKRQGLACWLLPQDPGPAGQRVIDIRICVALQPNHKPLPAAQEGAVNVWLGKPAHTTGAAWLSLPTAPTATQLHKLWTQQIEHTFFAS